MRVFNSTGGLVDLALADLRLRAISPGAIVYGGPNDASTKGAYVSINWHQALCDAVLDSPGAGWRTVCDVAGEGRFFGAVSWASYNGADAKLRITLDGQIVTWDMPEGQTKYLLGSIKDAPPFNGNPVGLLGSYQPGVPFKSGLKVEAYNSNFYDQSGYKQAGAIYNVYAG